MPRHSARRVIRLLHALSCAAIIGCGVADGVAPSTSAPVATQAGSNGAGGTGSSSTSGGAPRDSTGGGTGSNRSIAQWEEDEKVRVALQSEREKAVYDSLKVIWQQVLDDETGRWAGQLVCDPLQYVATVKVIGPSGGDIDFGPHKLRIPAGAVSAPTVITAEAPTSLQVLAKFSPHGTVFAAGRHPTLELSYKHCRNPPAHTARIGYLGPDGRIIEWPPSQDFPDEAMVRGIIGHFSAYIVAY